MKTSLIIPAYFLNGRFVDMTDRCIESSNNETTETILVDDGSPYQYVKKLPYKSKFIRRKENGGYAAAVNDGLRVASGDILVLGNNDLVFYEGWLRGLLAVLEEGFDIATCWTSDQEYKLDGVIKEGGKFGSIFAMKREVYDSVGEFDEQFRGYFSDLDYRWRALDAGFTIGMNHGMVVEHKAKATYRRTDPEDDEYLRSMRLYEAKYGVLE